ncbi:MAG: phosphatase PAP2 family protein [Candidatus Rokuibacteriota bacterium]
MTSRTRAVLIVSAAAFIALAAAAGLAGILDADVALRDAVLAWASPVVVATMRVVNLGGDWRVLLPGILLLFVVFPRARTRWWVWIALMVIAPLAEGTLKEIVGRARPEGPAMGFPSGHATAATAYFGAVAYLAGSLRTRAACVAVRSVAVVAIALVAAARVVLRAHWPSDVLGGIALGLALAAAAALVASNAERVE